MAKQMEGFIEGTIDDITFYKMGGEYYARMKSCLTRKRFFRDKAFEGSRRSFQRFGRGNQLASLVYNEIEESKRQYALYCAMKSAAILMLKHGKTEVEVVEVLRSMKPVVRVKVIGMKRVISQFGKELNRRGRGGRKGRRKLINQFDNSTIRQWGEESDERLRFGLSEEEEKNRRGRGGRRGGGRERGDVRRERVNLVRRLEERMMVRWRSI